MPTAQEDVLYKRRMRCDARERTGLPGGSVAKNLPANAGDTGLISGSGKSPEEGNGNPLQYACLA